MKSAGYKLRENSGDVTGFMKSVKGQKMPTIKSALNDPAKNKFGQIKSHRIFAMNYGSYQII